MIYALGFTMCSLLFTILYIIVLNTLCSSLYSTLNFLSLFATHYRFTLYTRSSTHYTLHSTLYTLNSTLSFTFYTLHSTLYTLHSTLHTIHYALYPLLYLNLYFIVPVSSLHCCAIFAYAAKHQHLSCKPGDI